jgi:hypothetical protein
MLVRGYELADSRPVTRNPQPATRNLLVSTSGQDEK